MVLAREDSKMGMFMLASLRMINSKEQVYSKIMLKWTGLVGFLKGEILFSLESTAMTVKIRIHKGFYSQSIKGRLHGSAKILI